MVFAEAVKEFLLKNWSMSTPTRSNFLNKILEKASKFPIWSMLGFEQFRSRQKRFPPPMRVCVKFILN